MTSSTEAKFKSPNSPCNPTSAELSPETLDGISEIAEKNDLFVISGEVYKHIRYNDLRYKSIAEISGMKGLIAVHLTDCNDEETRIIAESGASMIVNPASHRSKPGLQCKRQ